MQRGSRGKGWPIIKYIGTLCHKLCNNGSPIEVPFRVWTQVEIRKHVLYGGAHWHNRASTTEHSMCGGDVAFLCNYLRLNIKLRVITWLVWLVLVNIMSTCVVQCWWWDEHRNVLIDWGRAGSLLLEILRWRKLTAIHGEFTVSCDVLCLPDTYPI